ncbi:MAG: VCBS repeat-containing protein [Planctomycetota bacterium]
MNPRRFLCLSACGVLLAGLGLCPSLPAQQRAYILRGNTFDSLGSAMAGAGDLNRDGFPDLLVGADGRPYVAVFSGPDGRLLLRIDGPSGRSFGRSVASAGDVDGDGFPDILVGTVDHLGSFAEIYSGRTGLLLHHFDGPPDSAFGLGVAGIGDVDLDGFDDVVIGAPGLQPLRKPRRYQGKGLRLFRKGRMSFLGFFLPNCNLQSGKTSFPWARLEPGWCP